MVTRKKKRAPAPPPLAKFLKQVREERGLSLRNLEELTGISNPYLLDLERGGAKGYPNPSMDVLRRLSTGLEVPILYLMGLAGQITTQDLKELQPWRRRKNLLIKL